MERSVTTVVVHIAVNFKSSYIMDVWVYLNLNLRISMEYLIDYGFGSYKSVLYPFSTYDMSLVLGKRTSAALTNSYKELLMHFFPSKVYIDTGIRKILSENPLIKVCPKNNYL